MSRTYHVLLILSCACTSSVTPLPDARRADAALDGLLDLDAPPDLDATGDTQISDMRQRWDTRPQPAPEWIPPFAIADDIGWRDSDEPICNEFLGHQTSRVWADSRGVFVLNSVSNNPFSPGDPDSPSGSTLWHNDGTSWHTWWRTALPPGDAVPIHLAGVEGGSIYLGGGGCLVRKVSEAGSVQCAISGLAPSEGSYKNIAVLAEDDFSILTTQYVFRHVDDHRFRSSMIPSTSTRLSVAHAYRALLTTNGLFFAESQNYLRREDAPEATYSSFWMDSVDNIWMGLFDGSLLHFNGVTWTNIDSGITGVRSSIRAMWSHDGEIVFYASVNALGSWTEASGAQTIVQWDDPNTGIYDIHGNAEGELFIAMGDARFLPFECGSGFLLWYDGTVLRRF